MKILLAAEARWVGRALGKLDAAALSPLLNVGSATAEFREQIQPWIDSEIFAPLRKNGARVDHLDIQEGDGIDLHGDLTDHSYVSSLGHRGYNSLLCCNVLEHVPAPSEIAARLESIVPAGGYLVFTVPNRFPYHPDPIDTMFRPGPEDLARLFANSRLLDGAIVDCGSGWDYVGRNPIVMYRKIRRRMSGLKEHGGIGGSTSFFPWLFRQFRQTCILLQKN